MAGTGDMPSWIGRPTCPSGRCNALAIVSIFFASWVLVGQTFAQDAAKGELTAKTWCVGCHAMSAGGATLGGATAPSFSDIAQMASTNETSLEIFLSTSHPRMANYALTRDEIRDVSAYILSLRR